MAAALQWRDQAILLRSLHDRHKKRKPAGGPGEGVYRIAFMSKTVEQSLSRCRDAVRLWLV